MSTNPRGSIHNRARAKQINDFTGLQFGKITPTDLDGIIDFQNQVWVIIELKQVGNTLPFGQRLAIERLIDIIASAGKVAVAVIATHDTTPDQDVIVADCPVIEYRYLGAWLIPRGPITVKQAIYYFVNKKD